MPLQKEELVGTGEHKYPVGYKCDIELYRMVIKCSSLKDFSEWDTWMECNYATEKYLQGVDLEGNYLEHANFEGVHFERANFKRAHCEYTKFDNAHCEHADFFLTYCYFASFIEAHCEHANFYFSELKKIIFWKTHCEGAIFNSVDMDGAMFFESHLDGTLFSNVKVNQHTSIVNCSVNNSTFFVNTNIAAIIIEPGVRSFLERNTRKLAWYKWYPQQNFCTHFIAKAFWGLSDYGYNTTRIFMWFFAFTAFFAVLYTMFPFLLNAESILPCEPLAGRFFRMGAFATATMVTLGFSNTNVNIVPVSYMGTLVVTCNLLVGYFMLAVLVTRLAVLFQTLGPGMAVKPKANKKIPPSP